MRLQAADVVLDGVIIGKSMSADGLENDVATIQVSRYLKENGASIVMVSGFNSAGSCSPQAEIGKHAIFLIQQNGDALWSLSFRHGFDVMWSPDDSNVAEISRILERVPVTPSPASNNEVATAYGPPYALALLCGIPILLFGVIGIIAISKAKANGAI